ncbi:hypothetical protein SELMODRAFT_120066 [Selaginella moellendorffii]|uniref:glycerophosphodiester phosphodiesterase n=1 Tax=Selaginella moellendorffii TaxID=88036 RepID=D8SMH4_SELML|nr:glycerophosphodiester phosphodiesterase GDPD6 [Selaginella moellendorffii]EFJ14597.1 hypothetical protein SELMODRAFT_120066 [Selaginella moellendorffii]|eukprot:XP_002984547.1 glycerophosphodiester phosphodiesterase GDPD6 [Selaginella moellendorffii]
MWVGTFFIVFLAAVAGSSCGAARLYRFPRSARVAIQDWRPFNVAHRGSNGEIPEETALAYKRAIEEGADFIEADITATKDCVLICFHDPILDDVTDIAAHPEFRGRRATYEFEGQNLTGFFVVDFTFEELQRLRLRQRYSFRDPSFNGKLQIITFERFISIALEASRTVGIYPEIKSPVFMNKHVQWPQGKRVEDSFMEILQKYGYKGKYKSDDWNKQPIFIQSFAPTSLMYISNITDSPKIFLIDDATVRTQDTNQSYAEITSNRYLDFISNYVVGIGPWKDTIVPPNITTGYLMNATHLVSRAHSRHLQVHPYTFRNENQFLHFDFHEDPYEEFEYWIKTVKVDGLFTDFPGSLHRYQEWSSKE